MNLKQKSRETIDACRFCWMCRHICPIGNATGQERNTSRARALGLSMVLRETETLANVIDNAYECSLCGACTKECLTGWDPVAFTLDVRLQGALDGVTPGGVLRILETTEKTGNPYGKTEVDKELVAEMTTLPKTSDTLLFLGRDALYKNPKGAMDAIRLLKKSGVDFTVLENEPDSGFALNFLVGAAEETKNLMTSTAKRLNDFKTIVVYDPFDAKIFLREFKEWNIDLKSKIVPWPAFLTELIDAGKITPKKTDKKFSFQDPFSLARDLEDVESARKILSTCGELREMLLHGKDTMLAGHLLMAEYMPNEIELVARQRWADAENVGAEILVTASPSEYLCLQNTKPNDIELSSIEEVLLQCSST